MGTPLEAAVNPLTDSGYTVTRHALAQNPNWWNLDPRIGLAYDPFADHKTSIRAGFGIFHEPVEARTYALGYDTGPPSGFILTFCPPAASVSHTQNTPWINRSESAIGVRSMHLTRSSTHANGNRLHARLYR
jgi:hypothetical protein